MDDADRLARQTLVDRAEIQDVTLAYASALDRGDEEGVLRCLAPGFHAHYGPIHLEHAGMFVDFLRSRPSWRQSMHMLGNQYIVIEGDQAWADTYALVTQTSIDSSEPADLRMTGCRYSDRLVRHDGRWLIAERGGTPRWHPCGLAASDPKDRAIRWLVDRAQLRDLRMSYTLGVDFHRFEQFREVFAPQFVARFGPLEYSDIDAFIEFIRSTRQYFLSTQHFFGSQYVDVQGESARLQTYALITHREQRDGGVHVSTVANNPGYLDRALRHGSSWRIVESDFALDPPGAEPTAPPTSDDAAVQRLIDRACIEDVLVRFALGVDRRDPTLVRSCFDDGVSATIGDRTASGLEELVATVLSDAQRWPQTTHFVGNRLITVEGDAATSETYVYVSHKSDAGAYNQESDWAFNPVVLRDRLRKDKDGWVIVSREASVPERTAGS